MVLAWLWLREAVIAVRALPEATGSERDFYQGKLRTCRYFFRYEVPRVPERCQLLAALDDTCLTAEQAWF